MEDFFKLFDQFKHAFPEDAPSLTAFGDFVGKSGSRELFSRGNRAGHITASGIVASSDMERFLLLYHKGLGKWLQPGGHVEPGDVSLLCAAVREVKEETGLASVDYDVMSTGGGMCIVDLDSHYIPENTAKGEPGHFHHDVRFLFRLKDDALPVGIDPGESAGFRWLTPEEFPEYFNIDRILFRLPLFGHVFPFGDK